MDENESRTQPESRVSARLQVAQDLRNRSLHGAWCPRPDAAAVEISALLDSVPASLGRIARVAMSAAVHTKEDHQSPSTFLSDAGAVDIPKSRRGEAGLLLGADR